MTRHTVNTITSDALDQLYADLDQARQHTAAIAAQRDRLRQRMNTLADRWDTALAPDKPYARTLREEITCAPFDPEGAMTVQEYTERGRHLWAFRCWGTDTCNGWLGLGHHTQTSALAERERHVTEEHPAPTLDAPLRDQLQAAIKALGTSERILARIQALADEYPAGLDTALLEEALDTEQHRAPAPALWLLAGTRDLNIPTQHRFTARPVDPEMERAATARAVQVAADSEKTAAWFAAQSEPTPVRQYPDALREQAETGDLVVHPPAPADAEPEEQP